MVRGVGRTVFLSSFYCAGSSGVGVDGVRSLPSLSSENPRRRSEPVYFVCPVPPWSKLEGKIFGGSTRRVMSHGRVRVEKSG